MSTVTPTEFPEGTRVVDKMTGHRGIVAGWHRSSIVIRWDGGGTHSAPAHHMPLVSEAAWDFARGEARWTDKAQRKAEDAQREAIEEA